MSKFRGIFYIFLIAIQVGVAADFTWVTGGYGSDNDALWGATLPANWTGNVTPVNAAGNSISITNGWPDTAYGVNLIQLRDNTLLGTLDVDMSSDEGTINAQNSTYKLNFDNEGARAQLNGSGNHKLTLFLDVLLVDTTEFNVNNLSMIRISKGISGNGELIISGNSTSNEVYFRSGSYTYTGNTRIESGSLNFHSSNPTTWSTGNVIVNSPGKWDHTENTTSGWTLNSNQSLSGNGIISMYAGVNSESNALKSGGATISPGDDNIGSLNVTGAGLSLTGGNFIFEIGDGSEDSIVTNRLYLASSSSAGNIVVRDNGRKSTGNIALIDYSGDLTGSISDLNLVIPSHWSATLSDNSTNSTIDLNVTKISKYGTVFLIK